MRDPNRLNNFYKEFCELHKKYIPDWRFFQTISNFMGWIYQKKNIDPWFVEEDRALEYFKEYLGVLFEHEKD